MPRKQCRVRNLFVDVSNPGLKYKRVRCIYCDANIASNGTRMVSHLKKCKECTNATKNRYLGKNGNKSKPCDSIMPWKMPNDKSNAAKNIEMETVESDVMETDESDGDVPPKKKRVTSLPSKQMAGFVDIISRENNVSSCSEPLA